MQTKRLRTQPRSAGQREPEPFSCLAETRGPRDFAFLLFPAAGSVFLTSRDDTARSQREEGQRLRWSLLLGLQREKSRQDKDRDCNITRGHHPHPPCPLSARGAPRRGGEAAFLPGGGLTREAATPPRMTSHNPTPAHSGFSPALSYGQWAWLCVRRAGRGGEASLRACVEWAGCSEQPRMRA